MVNKNNTMDENKNPGQKDALQDYKGNTIRILVITLYTIENEFDECCAAIRAQTYRNFEHLVIKNLPNKEAHDTLYRTFERRSNEFDLMIKVDADMVIEDSRLFEKIAAKFTADPRLDWLCIQVHDFFCNRMIWGMNAYRNCVKWNYRDEQLFVDLILDYASVRKKLYDDHELTPAAIHCKNPAPFQAFHFGIHRGMKCAQPGRIKADRQVLHWKILRDIFTHYEQTHDPRLAFALAGVETALTCMYDESVVSTANPFLLNLFMRDFEGASETALLRYIHRMRLFRLAMLPYPLDFCIMYGIQRLKAVLHKVSAGKEAV